MTGDRAEWSLDEISAAVGLPKSTTHRLIHTLRDAGFLDSATTAGKYRLGLRSAVIGSYALRECRVPLAVRGVLRSLAAETGQTAGIAVRATDHAVTLHREPARAEAAKLGRRGMCPVHASAAGKVLLAYSPPDEVANIFGHRMRLQAYQPNTIRAVNQLLEVLEEVRAAGFAVDDEEYHLGVRCIAVPVPGPGGDVVQSLGISAPAGARSIEELRSADLARVEQAAREVAGRFDERSFSFV